MTTTKTWLVINEASGSYDEAEVARLKDAFADAGRPLTRTLVLPRDDAPGAAGLTSENVDLLAVYAGDGTLNAVITGVYEWRGTVLALPGGTQNLLAKALHGEATSADIVAALGAGKLIPARRDLIRTSQGDALCEVLAGPGAHWSDVREAMREGNVGGMAASLGQAIGQSAGGTPVRIAEPALGKAEGYPAVRLHPDGGVMKVDGYGAETLAEYAQQGLALLRRDFRDGPHDELGAHCEVTCVSSGPIELMIDGERRTGGAEETFALHPCPVEFLALSGHRSTQRA